MHISECRKLLKTLISTSYNELSRRNIRLEELEYGGPGFPLASTDKISKNSYVIKIACSALVSKADALYVLSHELAHILLDDIWELNISDLVDRFEGMLEDVVCDFIAYKKMKKLVFNNVITKREFLEAFKKYATGPESNINLYECLREELIRKITSLRETCKIVDEFLQELEVDNVESLDNYALLLLSLLLRENECLKM